MSNNSLKVQEVQAHHVISSRVSSRLSSVGVRNRLPNKVYTGKLRKLIARSLRLISSIGKPTLSLP